MYIVRKYMLFLWDSQININVFNERLVEIHKTIAVILCLLIFTFKILIVSLISRTNYIAI